VFTALYGLGLNKTVWAEEHQQFNPGDGVVVVVMWWLVIWWCCGGGGAVALVKGKMSFCGLHIG
jgi:hypothetical protein